MATAASRSFLRSSSSLRNAASVVSTVRSPLRLPTLRPTVGRIILRSPVETSFCLHSLFPMHSATASALMTSLLSVDSRVYGWISLGKDDTV